MNSDTYIYMLGAYCKNILTILLDFTYMIMYLIGKAVLHGLLKWVRFMTVVI